MRQPTSIDELFKTHLSSMPVEGEERLWNQLSVDLKREKKRRRAPLFWLVLGCLLTSSALTYWLSSGKAVPASSNIQAALPVSEKSLQATKPAMAFPSGSTKADKNTNTNTIVDTAEHSRLHQQKRMLKGKLSAVIESPDEATNEGIGESAPIADYIETSVFIPAKVNGDIHPKRLYNFIQSARQIKIETQSNQQDVLKKKESARQPVQLSLRAGADLFAKNKQVGYQLGLNINWPFQKGASVNTGLQFALSRLATQYRLANKPPQNTQADVTLNHLTMLQLPVTLQQMIGKSHLFGKVGLMPVYILTADIYNVPNSFTGNPADYRKFTINDINRFNVLFTAGVGYRFAGKWGFELNGTYGLGELVKNSYVNQSRVDGNFKNIQATVVYRIH